MPLVDYSEQAQALDAKLFCGHPWCSRTSCNILPYIAIRIFHGNGRSMALPWQGRVMEAGFRFKDDVVLCHMTDISSTKFVYYAPRWGDTEVRWEPFNTDQYFLWPYKSALILKADGLPTKDCIGFSRIARVLAEEISPYGLIGFGGLSSGESSDDDMDTDYDSDAKNATAASDTAESQSSEDGSQDDNQSGGGNVDSSEDESHMSVESESDSGEDEDGGDSADGENATEREVIDLTLIPTPPRRRNLVIVGEVIDLTI